MNQLYLLLWMIGIFVIVGFIFSMKAFSFLDKPSESRVSRIDGLRFFLASFVAFHHYVLSYEYFKHKPWKLDSITDYPINLKIGSFGVALFFMISGYVFSNVRIDSWTIFYKKRFFRITPIFTLSSCLCVILAFISHTQSINLTDLASKLYFWFDSGLTGSKPDLFGVTNTRYINAGVAWTLFYEWAFYFSLPLLKVCRDKIGHIPVAISILFVAIYVISNQSQIYATFVSFFAIGFLAYELPKHMYLSKKTCDITATALFLVMMLIANESYNIYYLPIIGALFIVISLGGDFFGLLTIRAFIRLGDASYSIYLLHGIAWYCMNMFLSAYMINLTQASYMLISTLTYFTMLILCSVTYKFIELPFINFSKRSYKQWTCIHKYKKMHFKYLEEYNG